MKKLSIKLAPVLLWLIFSAETVTAAERHVLHTGTPEVTSHLRRLAPLPADKRLLLSIGLPLRETNALSNLVNQIYHRGSTNFHHYLAPADFAQRFGPAEMDYEKVKDFAKSHHLQIVSTYGNRALVDVSGRAEDIEGMFHIHLNVYHHPTENREFFAPDAEPSIDPDLDISYVVGLDNYVLPHPLVKHELAKAKDSGNTNGSPGNTFYLGTGTGTNGWYQGNDFRHAYVPGVSSQGSGQVVGLFELDTYYPGNITEYESLAGLPNVPLNPVTLPNAPTTPGGGNGEVCIDIEMVISMAQSLKQVLIVIGATGPDAMNYLASPPNGVQLPLQVSSSWGFSGESQCDTQLIEMAAQGQTFFLASGDGGAPSNGVQNSSADYNYLTTVGGTELYMTNAGRGWQNETVWNNQFIGGASTGYIETALSIPYYQASVNPSANGGSSIYRNVPDVAMCADFCVGVVTATFTNGNPNINNQVQHLGGTSLAAPLWAAFTSLVNQQGSAQGLPSVGFLNPALYEIAQSPTYTNCFHDVTSGNNITTNSNNLYTAGPGYDNCTGLGSPNGQNMINALLNYSGPVFVNFNYTGSSPNGSYYNPYETIAQGLAHVSSGGTIFIENAGSSSEKPTITQPVTITASDGPATIGN